jgi:hypothetical protein
MLDQVLAIVRARFPRPPRTRREAKAMAREISRAIPGADGAVLLALTHLRSRTRVARAA